MYNVIHFFDNSCQSYEHKTNPINLSLRPSDINRLTAEGKSVSMHQLDGYLGYPDIASGVMPLEFVRGVDENDCWEASQKAKNKVKEYVKHKQNESVMTSNHEN